MYDDNLQRNYFTEKKELIALDNNKMSNMEKELMKVKSVITQK